MRQKQSNNNNNKLRKFVRQSFASNFLFTKFWRDSDVHDMVFFSARRLILVQVPGASISGRLVGFQEGQKRPGGNEGGVVLLSTSSSLHT